MRKGRAGLDMSMQIKSDDLNGPEIKALLQRHADEMEAASPPDSCHYLDLDELRAPEISFWSIWDDNCPLGCGALKEIDAEFGEIKSMHVHTDARGQGISDTMLDHILKEAHRRSYKRLSLETGAMAAFIPARKLYEKYQFEECPPFGDYVKNIHSIFMTKTLA